MRDVAQEPSADAVLAGSTEGVAIRRLAFSDLPQVTAIERRSFTTPWSLAMFVLELSKPTGICLAATVDGQLAAYVVCSRYDTVWHLMNIAVDPPHRRRGIASSLMRELDAEVARAGRPADITLEVRMSNRQAIAMYEGFGFKSAGIRRRYYTDNGEDALIMWRTRRAATPSP